MKKNNTDLDETVIASILSVFSRYASIEEVVLYGSRAKGNSKKGSDIDLTITKGDIDQSLLHQLEDELDDLLLPYEIDLSIFAHIENPNLIDHIKRVRKIFYTRNS